MELVDGCYYAGTRAVIKISDGTGTLLIPGDVPSARVARRKDQSASMAVFSPGFLLVSTSELRTSKMAEFPKAYYMMDPYSSVPTILVPTEAKKLAKLRRGNDC